MEVFFGSTMLTVLSKNKLLIIAMLFFLSLNSFAKKQKNSSPEILELLKNIAKSYNTITSFEAKFTQTKKTKLLKKPAVTYGTVIFQKPDNLVLTFDKPYDFSIYLNGKKATKINRKENTYSVVSLKKEKSNLMNFLNISKTFKFLDKYFYIEKLNTKGKLIYIICLPKKRRVKKKLKIVELWLSPENFIIKKLIIEEPDYTITEVNLDKIKINNPVEFKTFNFNLKGMDKQEWRQ